MSSMSFRSIVSRLLLLMIVGLACALPIDLHAQRAAGLNPLQTVGAEDSIPHVEAYQYIERSNRKTYSSTQIQGAVGGRLDSIYRLGSTGPAQCSQRWVHACEFNVKLDVGEDYDFGANTFSAQVVLAAQGGGLVHSPIKLSINQDAPEQVFHVSYHGSDSADFSALTYYFINITSFTASASVQPSLRLTIWYNEEQAIDARDITTPSSAVVTPVGSGGAMLHGNPVRLSWDLANACDTFPNYQVQLLRLYNLDTAKKAETQVKAKVDWDQALTVETDDGGRQIDLTVAEGTGYYLWRVRPIGSLYPGGVADARNWGAWSDAPAQGSSVEYEAPNQSSPPIPDAAFFYQQFDDDKNWIYGRGFAENGRISEGMSYVSGGGGTSQSQVRVRSGDSILAGGAVEDYSGRSGVGSMAAPVGIRSLSDGGTGYFGYVPQMLSGSGEYTAKDFDADGNYRSPAAASGGPVDAYYSSSNSDKSIPSASGYPFARSLYAGDGSGRIAEMSGVGPTHRIGGDGGGKERSVKVYYSSVSDMELVRLFGDEAPIDTSVRKVLMLDPNKVTTVQYVTKEGEVIATALQRSQGDTLLYALNESGINGTISDTIRGNRSRSVYSLTSNKRLSFTDSTDLTIDYRITPNTVSLDACGSYCATCDYHVRVILHNVDNPDSSREYPLTIGADQCGEVSERSLVTTVRVPPGTYIIERRLDANTVDTATITPDNPYGSTYATTFKNHIAQSMDSLIRSNDTIREVLRILNDPHPDFDSLFSFLRVNPDSVTSKTIHTSCCDVVIPIIKPDCAVDPCRDSVPDFEARLIDMWKGEFAPGADSLNLNRYFKHNGGDKYQSPPAQFPNGKGAFNFMIRKMLKERRPDSSYVYDCATLWNTWDAMVRGFKQMARKDAVSTDYNPDFDLLDEYLKRVGYHFVGTSTSGYDTLSGYYLYAYKYFNYTVVPGGPCELATGYNAGWVGNADSTARWEELYNCVNARSKTNSAVDQGMVDCFSSGDQHKIDSCVTATRNRLESECSRHCDEKYYEFMGDALAAFNKAGQQLDYDQAACLASALVDSCKNNCTLTVFTTAGHIDSLGSPAQWAAMAKVWEYTAGVELPVVDSLGNKSCGNDSAVLHEGWRVPRTNMIIDHLNMRLNEFRGNIGAGGADWNFKDALREIAPASIVDSLMDSVVFVPGQGNASFTLNGCSLQYTSDSVGIGDSVIGSPENPHPLVGHLNAFLERMWNYEWPEDSIRCSVTSQAFDSVGYVTAATSKEQLHQHVIDTANIYFSATFRNVNGDTASYPLSRYLQFAFSNNEGIYDGLWKLDPGQAKWRATIGGWITNVDTIITIDADHVMSVCRNGVPTCDYVGAGISIEGSVWCPDQRLDGFRIMRDYWSFHHDSIYDNAIDTPIVIWNDDVLYFTPENMALLKTLLQSSYNDVIGVYGEDSAGYLTYSFRKIEFDTTGQYLPDTAFRDTTFRVHSIRFFGHRVLSSSRTLHANICDTLECPSICLTWREPAPVDTSIAVGITPEPCGERAARKMLDGINGSIIRCIDGKLTQVESSYRSRCANGDSIKDQLIVTYPIDYYHFTLFYYDRAGNLVKTVPPKGVSPLSVANAKRTNHPSHTYVTEYAYNALGQVSRMKTPDGGTDRVWYDQWGRLRFAQDQRQSDAGQYSYVKYDRLGRIVESGQSGDSIAGNAFANKADLASFPPNGSERVFTVYDDTSGVRYLDGTPQHNLINRVSYVYDDDGVKTSYSYDPHGNVEWVAQDLPGFPRINYTKYFYEVVSGNVNEVRYNEGRGDQFYHRYEYDKDNRLTAVKTSRDGQIWDRDAGYSYYAHGDVRRREVGEDKLQGLDFTYTLQGSLKAVNHPSLTTSADPGADGAGNGFAPDSFAVAVGYYPGDFTHTGSSIADSASSSLSGTPLYDGGVSSTMSNIGKETPKGKFEGVTGETYRYDQMERIKSSSFQSGSGGAWSPTAQYGTTYAYDANGNIDTLSRRAFDSSGSNKMDSLRYAYYSSTNRLLRVTDAVTGDPFKEDISNQTSTSNYQYDGSGNLISDASLATTLTWTVDGKVRQMKATPSGRSLTVDYKYDAMGQRAVKQVTDRKTGDANTHVVTTYYVYDAAGRVMSIYEKRCEIPYDSDLDGKPDSVDKCPYTASANNLDSDGDGIGDACDNCPFVFNPDQADNDRDGKGNVCDNAPNFWNPVFHDKNGNGIDDPTEPNANQLAWDTDGDGLKDNVDPCPTVVNAATIPSSIVDTDGDGILDVCDNCPSVANSTQKDLNKLTPEGLACEPSNDCTWKLVEQPIYGMAREGVAVPDSIDLTTLAPDSIYTRRLGQKLYELDDHLGNARVIITDRKLSDIVAGVPRKFRAEMRSYTNLYPFGMEQPGRYMNGDAYRYGYNGMEQDSSIADDQYTTYFRLYDARLGRWLGIDPVTDPGGSPYVAMNNSPIMVVDPSGAIGSQPNSTGGSGDNPSTSEGDDPGPGGSGSSSGSQRSDATSVALDNRFLPPPYLQQQEGQYSSTGAVGGKPGYWHYDLDGSGDYMPEDVYKGMVAGFIDRQFLWGNDFTPEAAGFRSSDLKSMWFGWLYEEATKKYETVGPYVHNRWNPYFKGHQLYDNNGDILLLIDGGLAVWKLGGGVGGYVWKRFVVKSATEFASKAPLIVTANAVPAAVSRAMGDVAIDANALIRALENNELQALDAAMAGRHPVVSITSAKEFLKFGDEKLLREFLEARGGRMGQAATSEQIAALQRQATSLGRTLHNKDASVVGSAIREGIPIITRDKRLLKFMQNAGHLVETF